MYSLLAGMLPSQNQKEQHKHKRELRIAASGFPKSKAILRRQRLVEQPSSLAAASLGSQSNSVFLDGEC